MAKNAIILFPMLRVRHRSALFQNKEGVAQAGHPDKHTEDRQSCVYYTLNKIKKNRLITTEKTIIAFKSLKYVNSIAALCDC